MAEFESGGLLQHLRRTGAVPGWKDKDHQPHDTRASSHRFLSWCEQKMKKSRGQKWIKSHTYLFLSHTLSQNMCPIALSKMTEPDLIRPFNLTSSLENMVGTGWGLRTSKSHHRCTIHNVTAEWSRKWKEYSSSPVMCAHYLGFYSTNQL